MTDGKILSLDLDKFHIIGLDTRGMSLDTYRELLECMNEAIEMQESKLKYIIVPMMLAGENAIQLTREEIEGLLKKED